MELTGGIVMRRGTAVAVLIALALALLPMQGGAAPALDDAQVERWDWGKFWKYGGCALSIVAAPATGGLAWVAAGFACGAAITEFWTK
jgi:hypothetical protein